MLVHFGNVAFADATEPSAWVEDGKQVFLAQTQLEAYLAELEKYGVGQKMGLGELLGDKAPNGFFTTFENSIRLVAFNTFNFARWLFTNEEQTLLAEWSEQTEALIHTIAGFKVVYDVMGSRHVRLAEAYQIIETEPDYAPVRRQIESFSSSLWSQQILAAEPLPKRPLLPADFGLDFKTDFVNENWRTFLSEQVNIANVYIFLRGPAMISALGKTKLGAGIVQTLRLNKLIEAVKGLPGFVQKPALWMIYETADGCTIRYFYTAYSGFEKLDVRKIERITGYE